MQCGTKSGIYLSAWNILDALTRPGDKITILTPVHFCFKRMINLNGRVAIECPLLFDGEYYGLTMVLWKPVLPAAAGYSGFAIPITLWAGCGPGRNCKELRSCASIRCVHHVR